MSAPCFSALRVWAPVVASATVVTTLVTCVILAKTREVYTGGLAWPYFSDMGRDAPGYYIFCVGLSVVAVSIVLTWSFNYQFQRAALARPIADGIVGISVKRWAMVTAILGVISSIGLPVLGFFSTTSYPRVHDLGAQWFFFIETVAVLVNTIVSYKIYATVAASPELDSSDESNAEVPNVRSVRRTFLIQLVMAVFFFLAFLVYMPIGLSVVADLKHLTVQECLDRDLGAEYCKVEMRLDETFTKLWNYEEDLAATQMRALGQLACILTLVGYSVSFQSHDYKRVLGEEARGDSSKTQENGSYAAP